MKHSHKKRKTKKTVKQKPELITVILLCDCPGYRMKSYGPLPLIQIQNNKLLDIQIDSILSSIPNCEIILCVGFDSEKITKYVRQKYKKINIRIVENQLFTQSNSNESARLGLNNTLNNKILICDGNLLLNNKALSSIDYSQSCVLVEQHPCENLEIGVNINEAEEAQYFSFGAYKTWSEILFLHNDENIDFFRKVLSHQEKTKFLFESINEMLKNDIVIKCIENQYPVRKINNIKTYHLIKGKV